MCERNREFQLRMGLTRLPVEGVWAIGLPRALWCRSNFVQVDSANSRCRRTSRPHALTRTPRRPFCLAGVVRSSPIGTEVCRNLAARRTSWRGRQVPGIPCLDGRRQSTGLTSAMGWKAQCSTGRGPLRLPRAPEDLAALPRSHMHASPSARFDAAHRLNKHMIDDPPGDHTRPPGNRGRKCHRFPRGFLTYRRRPQKT